jgi:hypothetical protein
MVYPKWLKKADDRLVNSVPSLNFWPLDIERAVEMSKDAWRMCHNRGTENAMSVEDFLNKYQDEFENGFPEIAHKRLEME